VVVPSEPRIVVVNVSIDTSTTVERGVVGVTVIEGILIGPVMVMVVTPPPFGGDGGGESTWGCSCRLFMFSVHSAVGPPVLSMGILTGVITK
jgi:hypothetical protein